MRHRSVGVALVIAWCAVVAQSQTVVAVFHGSKTTDDFGHDVDVLGDLDGDGRPELLIGVPRDDTKGAASGRAVVLSSIDGHAIESFFGSAKFEQFGSGVASLGDPNHDGKVDVAVGAPGATSSGGPGAGEVRLMSGNTGQPYVIVDHDYAFEGFGSQVDPLPDLNGDGLREFVGVTESTCFLDCSGPPAAEPHDGGTGAWLQIPAGDDTVIVGDVDGDQHPDYVTSSNGENLSQVRLVSGASGQVLDKLKSSLSGFGCGGGAAADFDGDGRPEYVFVHREAATHSTQIEVRSLGHGTILALDIGDAGTDYGVPLVDARADVDGDGIPDFVIGAPYTHVPLEPFELGVVLVVSAADGHRIARIHGGPHDVEFGRCVATVGDWSGDGIADVLISTGVSNGTPSDFPRVEIVSMPLGVPWVDLGHALAGIAGEPHLTGSGTLQPGSPATIQLSSTAPLAPMVMVLGLETTPQPLKGGVLVPHPEAVFAGYQTGPSGTVNNSLDWPHDALPGLSIYIQAWILDAAGPHGWSASNGLAATTPE